MLLYQSSKLTDPLLLSDCDLRAWNDVSERSHINILQPHMPVCSRGFNPWGLTSSVNDFKDIILLQSGGDGLTILQIEIRYSK